MINPTILVSWHMSQTPHPFLMTRRFKRNRAPAARWPAREPLEVRAWRDGCNKENILSFAVKPQQPHNVFIEN
jgi:hypothetical protein